MEIKLFTDADVYQIVRLVAAGWTLTACGEWRKEGVSPAWDDEGKFAGSTMSREEAWAIQTETERG